MSRGRGKAQRGIVWLLRCAGSGLSTTAIAQEIYGEATASARVAVRRALQGLIAKGKIEIKFKVRRTLIRKGEIKTVQQKETIQGEIVERKPLSGRGDKRWAWKRADVKLPAWTPRRMRKRVQPELPGIDGRRDRKLRRPGASDSSFAMWHVELKAKDGVEMTDAELKFIRTVINPLGKRRAAKAAQDSPPQPPPRVYDEQDAIDLLRERGELPPEELLSNKDEDIPF